MVVLAQGAFKAMEPVVLNQGLFGEMETLVLDQGNWYRKRLLY